MADGKYFYFSDHRIGGIGLYVISGSNEINEGGILEKNNITLATYFKIIWKNKFKIIGFSLCIGILSVVISFFMPKWYKSTAVILSPSSSASGLTGLGGLANLGIGNLLGENESIFKYMAILKSRGLREEVVKKFNLIEKYKSDNLEQAVKKFTDNYRMEMGDEYQINITVFDKDQELVADITNYVVRCLDTTNIELSILKAQKDRKNIENRYFKLIDSLNVVTAELADYMKNNNIVNLEGQSTLGVEAAIQLKSQIFATETEMNILKQTMNPDNQLVKNRELQLNSLKNEYNKLINENSDFVPAFSKIPLLGLNIKKYEYQIQYLSKVLEFVAPQYEKYRLDEAKETPTLQVLDWGIRPERKCKPKRAIIGILTTFVAGIFAASFFIIKE
jgi:uncharacterized protein involved in exopolysaccharide biosynthesis